MGKKDVDGFLPLKGSDFHGCTPKKVFMRRSKSCRWGVPNNGDCGGGLGRGAFLVGFPSRFPQCLLKKDLLLLFVILKPQI